MKRKKDAEAAARDKDLWGRMGRGEGCGKAAAQWKPRKSHEENRGKCLTDRPGATVKLPGCCCFSVKCKRKIAWENFLNFSANIWLWQNKQTMRKKQRSDIASNGKNIYFLKHYATTFALMWKYLMDTEIPFSLPLQIPQHMQWQANVSFRLLWLWYRKYCGKKIRKIFMRWQSFSP